MIRIDVDNSGGALVENLEFRREVVFEVGVFDGRYMVSPDIEEAGGFEPKVQNAFVFQTVAGYLHDHDFSAGFLGVTQMAPQVRRFGRGVVAFVAYQAVVGFD